jgi:pimeloyl-ACP methyl ester carboxylesterase
MLLLHGFNQTAHTWDEFCHGTESDILAPDAAQRMVDAIPHGQLATVAGAGHSVMGDNPEGFYQAVKTFLDGVA